MPKCDFKALKEQSIERAQINNSCKCHGRKEMGARRTLPNNIHSDTYLWSFQTSIMELFAKIVYNFNY